MSLTHGLSGFVIRRLLLGLLTLWITSVIIFAATQALPGDAARSILGRSAQPESLAELRNQLGLDKPILTQYWDWISGVFAGDLGTSLANSVPVTEVIGEAEARFGRAMRVPVTITSPSLLDCGVPVIAAVRV